MKHVLESESLFFPKKALIYFENPKFFCFKLITNFKIFKIDKLQIY